MMRIIIRNCTDIGCLLFSVLCKDCEKKYFNPTRGKVCLPFNRRIYYPVSNCYLDYAAKGNSLAFL
ncbi:hypothetical protein DVQ85_02890 [Yersinia enterocolitica]|nr:hypothetical protein [Yersinia enterocolitica]EKN5986578.1 hypothetical protein [Yersinia enterocolitica]